MTKKLNRLNQDITASLKDSSDHQETFKFLEDHSPFMRWLEAIHLSSLYKDNPKCFIEALTHSSFVHENKDWGFEHNERLEFLGDAVLDLELSLILWSEHPELNEGELSRFRSSLVNEDTLASWAQVLGLQDFILLGKGEMNKAQVEPAILADAFEALLGAVVLTNKEACSGLIRVWIKIHDDFHEGREPQLMDIMRLNLFDPKTRLQEITLESHKLTPVYKSVAYEEQFSCEVFLEEQVLGHGTGTSKKRAEIAAAKNALIEMKKQ